MVVATWLAPGHAAAGHGPVHTPCAEGNFSSAANTSRNTYSESGASFNCASCPPGATSMMAGSADISRCECSVGYAQIFHGGNSTHANASGIQCRACEPGTFKNVTGNTSCAVCPENSYSGAASASCTKCVDNSHALAGSANKSACKCNLGYEGEPGAPCTIPQCAEGEFNPDSEKPFETYVLRCRTCPLNSFSNGGRSGIASCVCKPGFTGKSGGPCHACQVGEYKKEIGGAACSICSANSYTEREYAAITCLACPNNSIALEGSVGPTSCTCNEGYSGKDCLIFRPQNLRAECSPANSFRKFEMQLMFKAEADSDVQLALVKSKLSKEISRYFGRNSSLDNSFATATNKRSSVYDISLIVKVQGNPQKLTASKADLSTTLTSFLKQRGLSNVQVADILVKCGAGFTSSDAAGSSECIPCPRGTYKQLLDNSECLACPTASTTSKEGETDVSKCSEWAGQRLSRKTAEEAGQIISLVVGCLVGINSLTPVVMAFSRTWDVGDAWSESSLALQSNGLGNIWGWSSTMALITQVQLLQVIARIGGTHGQVGLFHLSKSLGWINFEYENASFWGDWRDAHITRFSPFDGSVQVETCSPEFLLPMLDKLVWCCVLLASVSLLRQSLCLLLDRVLGILPPDRMHFPSWEGPVVLLEFIALCTSVFAAVVSGCSPWMYVGYASLGTLTIFLVAYAIVLAQHVFSQHIVFESYDATSDQASKQPTLFEMQKSLQGASNISQKVLCVLEWYLARGLKGTWNNGNIDSWSVKFFVSDYAHHAWGFGLWVLAKKGLLVAAITVLDGRNSAIMSIIVLTIDLLLVLSLRPHASKVVSFSECISSVTNWLAVLNLCLLQWPGTLPLQLGEETAFVLALLGTCLGGIVAGLEAFMAALSLVLGFLGGCGMVLTKLFFSPTRSAPGNEPAPIVFTDVAQDWTLTPRSAGDVSQSMGSGQQPGTNNPLAHQDLDSQCMLQSDPAVLAAWYRQLAEYHEGLAKARGMSESDPVKQLSAINLRTTTDPNGAISIERKNSPNVGSEPSRITGMDSLQIPPSLLTPATTFSHRSVTSTPRNFSNDVGAGRASRVPVQRASRSTDKDGAESSTGDWRPARCAPKSADPPAPPPELSSMAQMSPRISDGAMHSAPARHSTPGLLQPRSPSPLRLSDREMTPVASTSPHHFVGRPDSRVSFDDPFAQLSTSRNHHGDTSIRGISSNQQRLIDPLLPLSIPPAPSYPAPAPPVGDWDNGFA